MPLSLSASLEDTLNRLTGESIMAQPGRDDGLIPAYSLLSELLSATESEPAIYAPVAEVRAKLDALLDTAKPFDDDSLGALRKLMEWIPAAVEAGNQGRPLPLWSSLGSTASVPAVAPVAAVDDQTPGDELMDLHLAENAELLTEFHAEALDHLAQIESSLLKLDETPDDRDALNQLFRSFHTIKGVSGFLHLTPMHTLTHEVESLLDLARNGKLTLDPTIITAILESRDAVQTMVGQITVALERGTLPDTIVPVRHLIQTVKQLAANPGGSTGTTPIPFPVTAPVPIPVAVAPVAAAVPAPKVEQAAAPFVETASPFGSASSAPFAAEAGTGKGTGSSSTVRVNTEKLDSLMNVVGELVIVQSQLAESGKGATDADTPLSRNLAQLARITKELQHSAMSLRLMTIKPTFQKMERLARDLARDFGKKVAFHAEGEETEVDRSVAEEIADPLVHMVRNSLDHGLETPEERIAAGKPEQGSIGLKAYHQGSHIVIELSDDGRGIDHERLRRKAIEKGIIAANATLSRDEALQLIFAPGFSTAEKVTSISGRGVGMDVVKRNIEKLRGKVVIETEVGKGTIFRIKLPLTTAIIDGLIVRVGEDRFILPSTSVQMALRPAPGSISTVHGKNEVLDHRGRILPIHRLYRQFGIRGAIENPADGIIVIIESYDRITALLVDEMVSKQEVVIKNLGGFLANLPGIVGGAILGDGSIALILDPASLAAA